MGREAELSALTSAVVDAAGGRPRVVLLGAEAGGGKTRLVGELAARVEGRALLLTGGCVAMSAAGPPYAPFVAGLRRLVRERGAAELVALLPGQRPGELARLLPELGEPAADADPATTRGRLFELLLGLIERLAEEQPVVLVIEDAHWADRSVRDLLRFLVRNLQDAAVVVVVTFRSDELHRTHPLRPLLAELDRWEGTTSLELPRLTYAQVASQLEGILGQRPDRALVGAVFARGEGVPLFTEALLSSDGSARSELPGSLRDLLLGAVTELPGQTQQVLRIAAVGGARTDHTLLAAVTRLDDPELTAAMLPAVSANVMISDDDGYAFRHELIREAVLADLLPGERHRAHRAFAEVLAAEPPVGPPRLPVALAVALHWRDAHEYERALRAAWEAAAGAKVDSAHVEQLRMLELVLEVWERVPQAPRYTGGDRVAVLGLAAEAALAAGEPVRGLELVQAAIDELGDTQPGGAHERERRASLLRLRALLRRERLLPGQVDDLEEALALARDPTRVRGEILIALIWAFARQGREGEARRLTGELRALAERLDDEVFWIRAQIAIAHIGAGESRDAVAALRQAQEAARRIGSGRLELHAYTAITHSLEGSGAHERAIEMSREGLARSRQLGLARTEGAPIAANLAESLTSAGRWDEALEVVEAALEQDPTLSWQSSLLVVRGQIAVARGELEVAAQTLRELGSLSTDGGGEVQRALPLAQLNILWRQTDGDLGGALAAAGSAISGSKMGADPRYVWPLLGSAMQVVTAASAAGLPRGSGDPAQLRQSLQAWAARVARPGPVERAHAASFMAEVSRVGGHSDLALWDAAAAAWDAVGQPYPRAYALLRAAGAAIGAGDRGVAADRLRQAAVLADHLRARPVRQRVDSLARRARIDLTTDQRVTVAAPFGLTQRELEVLELVAAGRSNREIAAELFISVKTASVHVSNILGKLGVASRGEAAATAYREHIVSTGDSRQRRIE